MSHKQAANSNGHNKKEEETGQHHRKIQVVTIAIDSENKSREPQLLLLQTNEKRGGFWQNITGSVENGENFIDAAKREIFEETGIKVTDPDYAPELIDLDLVFYFKDRLMRPVDERAFLLLLSKIPKKLLLDPKEHMDHQWHPISKVTEKNYKYPSNYHATIKALKSPYFVKEHQGILDKILPFVLIGFFFITN